MTPPQPYWSQETYLKAWQFAADAHEGQTVPGSPRPYIVHIAHVTMEILAAVQRTPLPISNPNLAVQCALLHDTIEDTPVTYELVKTTFGTAVANGVLALSKNPALPTKEQRIHDSLHRIQAQPPEVWMVKLADRIANLNPPPAYWTTDKIRAYRDEAITIYNALKPANTYLAQRLQTKIDQYQIYF